jgi:spore maturation protein CgeB
MARAWKSRDLNMRIVLVGIDRVPHMGASFNTALRDMGHSVRVVDERWAWTPLDRWPFRRFGQKVFGGRPSARGVLRRLLLRACTEFKPDLILAIKGGTLDADLLREVRTRTKAPLVMYSTDNPFNPSVSTQQYIDALAHWDVIATPRRANIPRLKQHCSGDVFYLPFGYDPALHHPERTATEPEKLRYRSDVAFVGSCDPDRVPFLDILARAEGLAVSFYGGYYKYTPALKRCDRGYALGRAYRLAVGNTGVALCLVRRANEDGHVMRTFETPACGAFMLTDRTADHEEMFEEDREAAFFSSPEELLDKAAFYVRNDGSRREIAERGHRRVTESPNTYADRLVQLLRHIS